MTDRRKVIDQSISTLQLTEELDWDRLLWVPGEKKFFLPSITIDPIDWGTALDWENIYLITPRMIEEASREVFRNMFLGSWDNPPAQPEPRQVRGYEWCECVPSRSGFIVPREMADRPVRRGTIRDLYSRY